MEVNDILFSVHDYDFEGDIFERGIYLHFGDTRIKVADDIKEFEAVVYRINHMVAEIKDTYQL